MSADASNYDLQTCALTDGCITMLSDNQACELSHFVPIL